MPLSFGLATISTIIILVLVRVLVRTRVRSRGETFDSTPYRPFGAAFCNDQAFWNNEAVISYSFIGGNAYQHVMVQECLSEWGNFVNLIFMQVGTHGQIRISFEPTKGTWSHIGRHCGALPDYEATMNLSIGTSASNDTQTQISRGTVLHEIGHALGLEHEHQSPSTKGVLTLKRRETIRHFDDECRWPEDEVEHNVLQRRHTTTYSPFDILSIMTYFLPSTTNKERIEVPQNYELSNLDKSYISLIYPQTWACPWQAGCWSIARALDIAGVDGLKREEILCATSADSVRRAFLQWNVEKTMQEPRPSLFCRIVKFLHR